MLLVVTVQWSPKGKYLQDSNIITDVNARGKLKLKPNILTGKLVAPKKLIGSATT